MWLHGDHTHVCGISWQWFEVTDRTAMYTNIATHPYMHVSKIKFSLEKPGSEATHMAHFLT